MPYTEQNRNERESEWRKWDLHIHSPYTHLNNKYSDSSIESFIEKIKKEKTTPKCCFFLLGLVPIALSSSILLR